MQQLKDMLPNLLRIVIIIGGFMLLKPQGFKNVMIYLVILYLYSTVKDIYKFKTWCVNLIRYVVFVVIIYTLAFVSRGYGILGLITFILIISCFKLFGTKESRLKYLSGVRKIEIMLFGRSLDKKNWENDKPTIKIKLRK